MVTRMCALYVEKIRKVYRRFISLEGAFAKMVLKIAEIFNINIIKEENWDVWPIFIFSLLWSPGCVLSMSRNVELEKFTVDLSR